MLKKPRKPHRKDKHKPLNIPGKATRILNLILIALALVVARVWFLSVIQYESKVEEAKKPQKRTVTKAANRGTIRDRFNIPLAINKVQYQAAILYSQLRQVPAITWEKDSEGKKVRRLHRREYIQKLAKLLAEELEMEESRIEDLIYSKAALYYNIPYVIKEEISERSYYRLKMLEKDWLGLQARCIPKRHYPMRRVASDIIGYMGAINKKEYEAVISEMNSIEEALLKIEEGSDVDLPGNLQSGEEALNRLKELRSKAYSINDYVGKSGIEGMFEEQLRGSQGKKCYYSDARGNFLRELPGSSEPTPGQRFLLTLSSELQEFAEELLIKNEETREPRVSNIRKGVKAQEPWIKGGAIVAMNPTNGDILAMASYPRFDPNDFIPSGDRDIDRDKQASVLRWFETEAYISDIWNQKRPLLREHYNKKYGITDETKYLTWDAYLTLTLTDESPVYHALSKLSQIKDAIKLQHAIEKLIAISGQKNLYSLFNVLYQREAGHEPHGGRLGAAAQQKMALTIAKHGAVIKQVKQVLDHYLGALKSNDDKVLFVDLCKLAVPSDRFSLSLIETAGSQSLSDYRNASAAMESVTETVKEMIRSLYHKESFLPWREEHQKTFLKEKRQEEKIERRYAKPYLDYLDEEEKRQFNKFWLLHRWQLLTTFLIGKWIEPHPDEKLQPYLSYLHSWQKELAEGAHTKMPWRDSYDKLNQALNGLKLESAVEYLQTLRGYNDLERPLYGKYRQIKQSKAGVQLEKQLAAAFYPKYGYGYARPLSYRSAAAQGSIFKLVTAYAGLKQRYEGTKTPNFDTLNPLTIDDRVFTSNKEQYIGYHQDGKPIPRYYNGGRLPRSLSSNLGQLNIISAIERSSNPYFSLIAGDILKDPEDLADAAKLFSFGAPTGIALPAEISGKVPDDLKENRTGLYALAIGQHTLTTTPLQTAVMLSAIANGGKVLQPKIVHLTAGVKPLYDTSCMLTPYRYQDPTIREEEDKSPLPQPQVTIYPTVCKREIFLPEEVRQILLEGMHRVVERSYKNSIGSLQQRYRDYPEAIKDFLALRGSIAGKTSTAESVESLGLDSERGTNTYNHLWFGGIFFDDNKQTFLFKDKFGKPELVVVVYLRYGAYGKDTSPIAAQIAKKWRTICQKQSGLILPH